MGNICRVTAQLWSRGLPRTNQRLFWGIEFTPVISTYSCIHTPWSIFTFPGQNKPRPGHRTPWVNSGTIPVIPGRLASLTASPTSYGICGALWAQDGLSWHYNIVLLWIKKWKILNPYNLESITVTWWCCLNFFFVCETKFRGKVTSGGFHCIKEERSMAGGGFDTWGNHPSSARLRPHGPWRTGEIRGPWPCLKS